MPVCLEAVVNGMADIATGQCVLLSFCLLIDEYIRMMTITLYCPEKVWRCRHQLLCLPAAVVEWHSYSCNFTRLL